ncbi:MAG: hypothetical protein AB1720_08800 [Pseudomonadota bacterium]
MNPPFLTALLVAAALASLSGCETPPVRGDVRVHDRDVDVRIVFSDHDRRILRDYYRVDYRALPPGLAKQGKVPPGHAHRIMVRQPLPPGLEWGYLPSRLERQLSRLPDGYVRVIVGGSVAIMNVRTRVIFDLIENIHD